MVKAMTEAQSQALAAYDQQFDQSLARVDQSIEAMTSVAENDRAERELAHDQAMDEESLRIKREQAAKAPESTA